MTHLPRIGWSSSPPARPFDRDDLQALARHRERQTGQDALAFVVMTRFLQ
jgi:hypothetical protein